MSAPLPRLALACLRDGIHPRDMPRPLQRAILDLILSGDVEVTPMDSASGTDRHADGSVTEAVTRHVTQPLTQAERAKRAREKRKAELAKRHGAVTLARDGVRDEGVTASRHASRDALSLSSPQDSSSSPEPPPSEPLDETPGGRDDASRVTSHAITLGEALGEAPEGRRADLVTALLRAYRDAYEGAFGTTWGGAAASRGHVTSVAIWCESQRDPASAAARVIDGAFASGSMRAKRAPWKWIAEDPAQHADASTLPSATRPSAPVRPIPSLPIPTELPADAAF